MHEKGFYSGFPKRSAPTFLSYVESHKVHPMMCLEYVATLVASRFRLKINQQLSNARFPAVLEYHMQILEKELGCWHIFLAQTIFFPDGVPLKFLGTNGLQTNRL